MFPFWDDPQRNDLFQMAEHLETPFPQVVLLGILWSYSSAAEMNCRAVGSDMFLGLRHFDSAKTSGETLWNFKACLNEGFL